jgi:hypothetical protein
VGEEAKQCWGIIDERTWMVDMGMCVDTNGLPDLDDV